MSIHSSARFAAALALVLSACSHDVTSPSPALQSVAPDLAWNGPAVSQPGGKTPVSLFGSDFTGPGRAIGELLFQYGTLDHTATGDANTGATTLSVGYRMLFWSRVVNSRGLPDGQIAAKATVAA